MSLLLLSRIRYSSAEVARPLPGGLALDGVSLFELLSARGTQIRCSAPPGGHPLAADITPEDRDYPVSEHPKGVDHKKGWTTRQLSRDDIRKRYFSDHKEREDKGAGLAFTPGPILGEERNQKSVPRWGWFPIDIDKETPESAAALRERLLTSGLAVDIYSTFSNLSTETEVNVDKFSDFAKAKGMAVESDHTAGAFFKDKGYPESIVASARLIEADRETPKGLMTVIGHDPIAKLRVIFWPDEDYVVRHLRDRYGITEKAARTDVLHFCIERVARSFGLSYDASRTTMDGAFFAASCKPKQSDFAIDESSPGKCLRLEALLPADESELKAFIEAKAPPKKTGTRAPGAEAKRNTDASAFDVTVDGFAFNLIDWIKQGGEGFELDSALNVEEVAPRAEGGRHVECPFEYDHTAPGGAGTFVVDASDNDGAFRVHCCHTSCLTERGNGGKGVDRALFVKAFIELGALTLETLRDPALYVDGKVPECLLEKPTKVSIRAAIVRLSIAFTSDDIDPILDAIAWFNDRAFDAEALGLIKETTKKNQTTKLDEEILKRRRKLDSLRGEEASQESREALEAAMARYERDYAIIGTGGKGYVMDMTQPDVSQAIMPRDDFVFLHSQEWVEIDAGDGTVETLYPAKIFVNKPPKSAKVYRGGLVFRPQGIVRPDQFNLWKGFEVKPDSSGDCSLVYTLLKEVWAPGDEAAYLWLLEWLYHVIKYPGQRVGTALGVRGKPGDGKSIIFELVMADILGDMNLVVTNPNLIMGDFNEILAKKLLIASDEAAFAGNTAYFDRGKSIITGPKLTINPKNKAPLVIDNYARMALLSNHEHFAHIEADDRRYTVYETNPCWNGSDKFEKLAEQWKAKGGAAKFVHDALNHEFRTLNDRQQLVVTTNLQTKAAVRQKALSRKSLPKCVARLILDGHLDPFKDEPTVGWAWDEEWEIESIELERLVGLWLRDFDLNAMKFALTQHTLIKVLEQFIGKTRTCRDKQGNDGKRSWGPTRRVLPGRRWALWNAWVKGLLTDEEFEAAGGDDRLQGPPPP